MRLQLVGNYTLDEFQEAVSKILKDLETNKIESLRNINIYLRTCVDGRDIQLTDAGQDVDHLIFDFGRRRQIANLSGDLSVVTAHKIKSTSSEEE